MPEAIKLKQHLAVRRVIDTLRGSRPLRSVISRTSELNLRMLAEVKPGQTRQLLKNLLFLRFNEGTPKKLIVPDGLYSRLNQKALQTLSQDVGQLAKLIDAEGVVDLRDIGLRRKPGYVDITPNIKKPSLSEQIETIDRTGEAIKMADRAGDRELGDLMLYETLLNASIELFRIGETRSWAKRHGEIGITEQFRRQMLDFAGKLDTLIKTFPFGTAGYRVMAREKMEIARDMVLKMNNPAGDATLAGLIRKMSEILDDHENARVQRQKSAIAHGKPNRKIRITDRSKGKFEITRTFYELDENGVMRRVYKDVPFECARDLLQSFEHEKESISGEKGRVQALISELLRIAEHPLENYPELFEYSLGRRGLNWEMSGEEKDIARDYYSALRDMRKRKAILTLWGAEQLVRIPDDQARSLASSLIRSAARDYEKRVEVLKAEIQAVPRQQAYAEELIGELVVKLAARWTEFFLKYNNFDLKHIRLIGERLGKYFSTFFKVDKEKENPNWIRQERAVLVGLLAIFRPFKRILGEGSVLSRRLEELEKQPATAALTMEKRTINAQLKTLRRRLRGTGYFEASLKAAQQILLLEFNFLNRERKMNSKERKAALRAFYAEKAKVYGKKIIPAYLG